MKYIITESRLNKLIYNYLDDNFSDLHTELNPRFKQYVYYVKGQEMIFVYVPKTEEVVTEDVYMFSPLEYLFSMSQNQLIPIVRDWLSKTYNIPIKGFKVL
jgi:hypothetical protein